MKRAREPAKVDGVEEPKTSKPKKSKKKQPKPSSIAGVSGGVFKGYDLSEVPREAWPQPGDNKGSHGYTIKSQNGAVIRHGAGSSFRFFGLDKIETNVSKK